METVNHEYYVSLEVAKLLKEAGFDWGCREYYPENFLTSRYEEYAKPTIEVAQRWLREVKGIYIMVFKDFTTIDGWHYFVVKKEDWELGNESNFYQQESNNHTYEEAQEAGIKKALEMILEKGE